jgi:hypothetical protein
MRGSSPIWCSRARPPFSKNSHAGGSRILRGLRGGSLVPGPAALANGSLPAGACVCRADSRSAPGAAADFPACHAAAQSAEFAGAGRSA